MKRLLSLLLLMIAMTCGALAQGKWESKLDQSIYNPVMSPNGARLLYFTDDDVVEAHCVDVATGNKAWSRALKDFEMVNIGRFIGNDTVLLGQENRYEFINARDGAVYATLPIVGESWDDLEWEHKADEKADTLKPFFKDDVGVFYFDDGMQIIDLSNAKIIYQTPSAPSKVKHTVWETVVLINALSGSDSIYFVDVAQKKVVYVAEESQDKLNPSVYQQFAISNGELLMFTEYDIQSIDLATSKRNTTIKIDPDDPEFYTPVIFSNGLYLMVSDEGIQSLYKTKTGELLWKSKENAIPGVAEQLVELPNDEALLYAYDDDSRMMLYNVSMKTGEIKWSRHLFTHDGDFETGHKEKGQFLAALGKIAMIMLHATSRTSAGRFGRNPYTGMMGYHEPYYGSSFSDRRHREAGFRRANEMYNSWISREKECDGYTSLLEMNDGKAVFVAAGKVYSPASNGNADSYNGEGVFTVDLKDGSIANSQPCQLLAGSEKSGFNAVKDMNIQKLDATNARALIGVHDVYVARSENIERIPFGEETIMFLNSSTREVTIRASHDNEYYDYWRIDASQTPARKTLLARSFVPNILFHDTLAVTTTLKVEEESITAYEPVVGDVTATSFSKPKWTVNEDQLEELDLGDLGDRVTFDNRLNGIRISGANVYLLGSDAIGYISADGKCQWRHEWEPSIRETKLGFTLFDRAFVYATGGAAGIVTTGCDAKPLSRSEIDFSDTQFLHNEKDRAVIVDTDEGIIRGFSF